MTTDGTTLTGRPAPTSGRVGAVLGLGMLGLGLLALAACATSSPGDPLAAAAADSSRPVALVYRGPGGCPSCSEAAAELVQGTTWGFEVRFVGPGEDLQLTSTTLRAADLYVQPGGDGSLEEAFAALGPAAADIREYVDSGGRYLGLCMGGYLAGSEPGFELLPGDSNQFITSEGASVTDVADTIVEVAWAGEPRFLYFQDGPLFVLADDGAGGEEVLARYGNGEIAALVAPYGSGAVAVSGPHPEATADWYRANDVTDPDGEDADLGRELIDALMEE